MRSFRRTVTEFCTSPAGIVLACSLAVLTAMLLITHHFKAYSSDDVVWQNALLWWRHAGADTYYSDGAASFIAKAPLFWLLGLAIPPSRALLFIESAGLVLANMVIVFYCVLFFMRKWGIHARYDTLLPFVWVASFGWYMTQLLLIPNLRNVEIGAIFLLYTACAKVYYGDWTLRRSTRGVAFGLLGSALTGIAVLHDQYILYFGVAPVILFSAYLAWCDPARRVRMAAVIGYTGIGVILSKLFTKLAIAAGISLPSGAPAAFVPFEKLPDSITAALHSLFIIFGADFWGKTITKPLTIMYLCNAFVLGALLWGVAHWLRQAGGKKMQDTRRWICFFAATFAGSLALYAVSTMSIGTSTYRYLILLPFIGLVLLPAVIANSTERARRLITALLLAAVLLNVGAFTLRPRAVIGTVVNQANADNYAVLRVLTAHHLTKGYANYWDANINSYLSKGTIDVVPVICDSQAYKPLRWLDTESQITKQSSRSFLILNPQFIGQGLCDAHTTATILGTPQETITVNSTRILIYGHDVLK